MKIRFTLILVALFTLGASSPAPVQLTNLELDVLDNVWLDGDRLAFRVSEARQGADLNGDSDTLDSVLHVHDFGTGLTSNLKLDVLDNVWLNGNRLALRVSEARHGSDLNSDGDTFDSVLHVHDFGTGVTRNLELDALGDVWLDGDRLAFRVSEARHGSDLNGDSDTRDFVLHVHDLGTGVTSNLELAAAQVWLDGDRLAFRVSEVPQGVDLNGDGDQFDLVLHVHDFGTGETSNLGLASEGVGLDGDRLAFGVGEFRQGADLNGDGDKFDLVLHVYDFETGVTSNLGIASEGIWLHGDRLAYRVSEASQGADLNGDSDTLDSVLHVHDFGTGLTSNLQLDGLDNVWLDGDRLSFLVDEDSQEADLNGDSDTDDFVLHVHDFGTGLTSNLELDASGGIWLDGDRLAYRVSEASQGADLNGDSDERDFVLHTGTFPSFASGALMPLAAGTPSGAGSP